MEIAGWSQPASIRVSPSCSDQHKQQFVDYMSSENRSSWGRGLREGQEKETRSEQRLDNLHLHICASPPNGRQSSPSIVQVTRATVEVAIVGSVLLSAFDTVGQFAVQLDLRGPVLFRVLTCVIWLHCICY